MEEQQQAISQGDEIHLGEYFAILRPHWWKIALLSLTVGVVTVFVTLLKPDMYRAVAVVTPSTDEGKQTPALGVLASIGITAGGPTKVEDIDTLFRSDDLTVRVFKKYNLWPIVYKDWFDAPSGNLRFGWIDRLFSGEKGSRPPNDWDAIRAAKDRLKVIPRRNTGAVTISFDSPSAEGSANIVRYYLEEGKSRLQEEALERATRNKQFIQDQIGKTVDALTRDRLYSLYGQEVEREMLARNREQFGFRVIDSPRMPDRNSSPRRALIAFFGMVLSFPLWTIIYVTWGRRNASFS